jgi:hypothetical protein
MSYADVTSMGTEDLIDRLRTYRAYHDAVADFYDYTDTNGPLSAPITEVKDELARRAGDGVAS